MAGARARSRPRPVGRVAAARLAGPDGTPPHIGPLTGWASSSAGLAQSQAGAARAAGPHPRTGRDTDTGAHDTHTHTQTQGHRHSALGHTACGGEAATPPEGRRPSSCLRSPGSRRPCSRGVRDAVPLPFLPIGRAAAGPCACVRARRRPGPGAERVSLVSLAVFRAALSAWVPGAPAPLWSRLLRGHGARSPVPTGPEAPGGRAIWRPGHAERGRRG